MTFRKIILFLLISLSLVANAQLECQQSDRYQRRLPFLSCHLSSVQYAASGSMKACTELRTILM